MFIACFVAVYILAPNTAICLLGLPFFVGMAAHRYRIKLNGAVAVGLLVLAALAHLTPGWSIALAYGGLWLASVPKLPSYDGDYSYGTYIFAWPVQQGHRARRTRHWTNSTNGRRDPCYLGGRGSVLVCDRAALAVRRPAISWI